jgi:4-hydroxybenzoyl-CoA thioesterase
VSLQCDFTAPSRWNDTLRQVLEVRRLGGASFQFDVRFEGQDGRPRLSARLTIVTMDLDRMKAAPLPADLRERLMAYLVPQDDFSDSKEKRTTQ